MNVLVEALFIIFIKKNWLLRQILSLSQFILIYNIRVQYYSGRFNAIKRNEANSIWHKIRNVLGILHCLSGWSSCWETQAVIGRQRNVTKRRRQEGKNSTLNRQRNHCVQNWALEKKGKSVKWRSCGPTLSFQPPFCNSDTERNDADTLEILFWSHT